MSPWWLVVAWLVGIAMIAYPALALADEDHVLDAAACVLIWPAWVVVAILLAPIALAMGLSWCLWSDLADFADPGASQ